MKITVLDGYALNPGDLSWDALGALGELTVYDRTAPDQTVGRIGDSEVVLTNKTILTAEILSACPSVRYIGVLATGYNVVDLDYCSAHDIVVTNIPAYSTPSVVQMVFALLFELTNRVGLHSDAVHRGEWCTSRDFCFWNTPQIELAGKTMCIVGFGRIGRAVAQAALAFGMKVIAVPRDPNTTAPMEQVSFVSLEDGFRQADVVSLNCPLTEATRGLICAQTIALLKPTAFLINTARGPLVNEADLAQALKENRIAGFAADVVTVEPMRTDNPLLGAPNCILTPHIAWATIDARRRLMEIAVGNVQCYQSGTPRNAVN
ncbi:MAG: D-2-hydroxyacid dehydrogenase [Butyricicoccaceae bacterium]